MVSLFYYFFLFPLLAVSTTTSSSAAALPLSTESRWIVDQSGHRTKLACVNWPSHLEVMVAEGLSKKPAEQISSEIIDLGFNCVRLTWPLFLFTNDTLASLTVRQSFKNLGLFEAIAGLQINNPSIIDLSLINAYKAVVGSLAKKNVMIILDNHTSKPGWCCSNFDGNGFFGDVYFNPDLWIKGLTRVATIFNDTPNVVAMSLRNELRGSRQNVDDWYRYMQKGAEAVHAANPNVLVILSGLNYDRDLSFLLKKPVSLSFSNKLVFELHWYGFSDGEAWENGNLNQVCGARVGETMRKAGFLLDQGYPLFLSEFGVDMRGTNVNDNRYLNCFMGWAAELDLDWALWVLTGSYYLREGVVGFDETYGVYNWNWCGVRNQTILHKISALQYPFKGPGYSEARLHQVIFHPMTGLCVKRLSLVDPLVLGPCSEAESWTYTPQKTLTIKGTYFCLQADKLGKPAKLGVICSYASSKWEAISDSKMHLSSKLKDGYDVCLDIDSDNNIVTNNCKCLDKNSRCDPGSQWFKIIDSTRCGADNSLPEISSIVKLISKNLLASFSL
ncbi:glycosyl hydrolase 5 family protein-like [Salvia hispanica]|uniref:glycosyl hydrolase 5 family protein-like n=1 Tax=Salvia hispanica TaxID=49212 RepID=UPI0020099C9C|nr:glycosyl hydrolase 5 family protein-like [Salvia hispanica]XP_047970750.1 glycosyl hydrolase 5 family protein-like [Salvia hispanica]